MGGELDKHHYLNYYIPNNRRVNHNQLSPKKNKSSYSNNSSNRRSISAKKIYIINERGGKRKGKIYIPFNSSSINKELNVLELIQDKNPQKVDYDLIYNCIGKHYFMQSLNDNERNEIIINISLYKIKPNEILYNQGSNGYFWYIVHKGELEFYVDGERKKTFHKGDNFGEIALMNNCPRQGTVKSITQCELWALSKEDFEKIKEYLFKLNYKENMEFIKNIKIPVDDQIKSKMANYLVKNIYKERDIICKKGEPSSCIYIIKEGEVNFFKDGKLIGTEKKMDYFGQNGLFEGHRRTVDAIAKTNCIIYTISNDFFQNQFGNDFKDQLYFSLLKIALSQSDNFNSINNYLLNKAFHFFNFKSFKKHETIYKEGIDVTKNICVILDGNIIEKGNNKIIGETYDILFEDKVVNKSQYLIKNDLLAESNCIIAEALYENVKKALGGDISFVKKVSKELMVIDKIKLFENLSVSKKEIIQKNLKIEKFNNGQKILIQGEIGKKLYIIKQGKVDFYLDSKYMKSKFEGNDFGSKSLILDDRKNLSTIVANGYVECYTLSSDIFKNILNPQLREYFLKQYYLNDYSIELEDLDNIKELGCGSYGVVNLVRSRKNKQLYASKALDLIQIKEENILKRVELEKSLLLKMEHPFIAKTVKYIKGKVYLFYIMEYVRGKELFDVMRDINLFNTAQTQFYSGSIIEVINYLHKQKIIYRDLKPENIMVLENGYIKFFDFGTVKEIRDKTKTFIGTTSYMAPEIFTGNGYSFQVDMWALGIMMYEFFCGKLPFGEDIEDPMEFYKVMIRQNLIFPSYIHDYEFKDLIKKLLVKDPNKRLNQYLKIKNHPYFKDFDWDKLISLDLKAPYSFKLYDKIQIKNNPMSYINYLKSLGKKPYNKIKESIRQKNFRKWFDDF